MTCVRACMGRARYTPAVYYANPTFFLSLSLSLRRAFDCGLQYFDDVALVVGEEVTAGLMWCIYFSEGYITLFLAFLRSRTERKKQNKKNASSFIR